MARDISIAIPSITLSNSVWKRASLNFSSKSSRDQSVSGQLDVHERTCDVRGIQEPLSYWTLVPSSSQITDARFSCTPQELSPPPLLTCKDETNSILMSSIPLDSASSLSLNSTIRDNPLVSVSEQNSPIWALYDQSGLCRWVGVNILFGRFDRHSIEHQQSIIAKAEHAVSCSLSADGKIYFLTADASFECCWVADI